MGRPTLSESAPTAGARFTLRATVRNQGSGSSSSTTLRYYRSTDSTITASDTELGTDSVSGLRSSGISDESISLNAPSTPRTYYYGACVDTATEESDTTNNCSSAVQLTVGAEPATPSPTATPTRAQSDPDRAVLVALYHSTGGANWDANTNWLSDRPIGEWHGVTTNSNGRVIRLELHDNQLTGEIPPELGGLSNLTGLTLYNNQLTGEIPPELGGLSNLTSLTLGGNQLTGEIPPELGRLSNLTWLWLSNNQLTGEIPPELGRLSNLRSLGLSYNQLTGEIPPELGGLSNLRWLYLSGSQLTGCLPEGLRDIEQNDFAELNLPDCGAAPAPDLVVDRPTLSESAPTAGARFTLSATVRNQGSGSSSSTTLRYYRSTDSAITNSDTSVGTDSVSGLNSSGSGDESINLTAPSTPGTYYYGVCVDAVTGESDTTNNCSAGVTVVVGAAPAPDLVVDTPTVDKSAPAAGARFTLTATVRNQGNGPSAFTTLRYYRSTDSTITASDTELGTDSVSGLRSSGSSPESISLTAPSTAGIYYYGACVDAVTGESDTTSNCSAAVTVTVGAAPAPDRAVLVALYHSTGGANWDANTNWLSDRPIGEWLGVTTNSNGRVTELDLNANGLTGEIPPELGGLSNLEWLYLGGNQLTGEIPPELGGLSNLTLLYLTSNRLTGGIPPELGGLSYLTWLDLDSNRLTGEIPPELGGLSNLTHLYLSSNQLTGCIPEGLRDITENDLVSLNLPDCGAAPAPDRAVLVALYHSTGGANWVVNTNWLSDRPIGEWHGVATDSKGRVVGLYLSENQVKGEIPPELGRLSNLTDLYLDSNQLTGEIPPELGGLSNLGFLYLQFNQLTGGIPPELGRLSNLTWLELHDNQLTGGIPPELGRLSNLGALSLDSNQLTGEIPPELGGLSNLTYLRLNYNRLTGEIPPELGGLSNLVALYLSNNQLTGCIPEGLRDITENDLVSLNLPDCGAAPAPDLVVDRPTLSESAPTAGARFTLNATVRNQGSGSSSSTTVRYYRSTDE